MIKRLLLVLTAFLLLAGCGNIRGERVETGFGGAPEGSSLPQGQERAAVLEALPVSSPSEPIDLGAEDASASFDFTATELYSGTRIEGEDLFGQGAVLVTFVQPGCEISVDGGPTIAEAADLHPEAIYVIVHSGADDEAYLAFAEEAELYEENMVHISDHYGALAARYGVVDYPTTLLIDTDMRITSVIGVMDAEAQLEAVTSVIGAEI